VVPAWRGDLLLSSAPGVASWIRARQREGADVLMHGFRHDEAGSPRSPIDWIRAVGRTSGEGEFLTLGAEQALPRILEGLRALRSVGLDPVGFVPPAWLARPGLRRALRDAGLPVTEDVARLWLTHGDVAFPSPVIRWSARSTWRAVGSSVVAAVRSRTRTHAAMLRIALHPRDLRSRQVRDSIRHTFDRVRRSRTPMTYSQFAAQECMGRAA
jgi:predicted deacetylase